MITINMFSQAESVKGQGVGSAYIELIKMLKKHFNHLFQININQYTPSDISHYHTVNPQYYLSTFLKGRRGKTVGYVHFLPETLEGSLKLNKVSRKIAEKYVLAFYRRMDQLVVVNPVFGKELEKYNFPAEKITYIPNFVSKEQFFPINTAEKLAFRQQTGIAEEAFVVMGAGQIQKRKGVDDFFQLAYDNPDIQFIWVGGFSFGRMTDGYEKYTKVYNNPPANLKFTGIVDRDEMNKYYNIADVFLLPSYNELFPMSILEAFSCGTPVMVRDLELYRAIIDGYYLNAKDRSEMESILRNLKANPQLLEPYQAKSLAASDYYSEENVAQMWREFYEGLLE